MSKMGNSFCAVLSSDVKAENNPGAAEITSHHVKRLKSDVKRLDFKPFSLFIIRSVSLRKEEIRLCVDATLNAQESFESRRAGQFI